MGQPPSRREATRPREEAAAASGALRAVADQYAERLQALLGWNLVSVVLYGSVARHEATPDSDVDLLVVGENLPEGRFARLDLLEPAERALDRDLVTLPQPGCRHAPGRHRAYAERGGAHGSTLPGYGGDAVLLYDRGAFFSGILAHLRARLRELGAERRQRGKVRYWVLKPDAVPGEVIEL